MSYPTAGKLFDVNLLAAQRGADPAAADGATAAASAASAGSLHASKRAKGGAAALLSYATQRSNPLAQRPWALLGPFQGTTPRPRRKQFYTSSLLQPGM